MKYKLVVCGGTFDHFHRGHEGFLLFILSLSDKVLLGLTTDKYILDKKLNSSIENYNKRKNSIEEFFSKENVLGRVEIEPIDNVFIPRKWEKLSIDAIVVSKNTEKGGELINQKRKELGLKPLKILIAPPVFAEDGDLISSERIRNGEINRAGKLYLSPLWRKKKLILPESLRKELKKPFGTVISNAENLGNLNSSLASTVGDVTTQLFNKLSIHQHISVIDFLVAREKKFSSIKDLGFLENRETLQSRVKNPPGSLTSELFKVCQKAWRQKKKVIIVVQGEEDLSVLPLVLTAPLGAIVFYGQKGQGIVRVEVSETTKEKAYYLTSAFKY